MLTVGSLLHRQSGEPGVGRTRQRRERTGERVGYRRPCGGPVRSRRVGSWGHAKPVGDSRLKSRAFDAKTDGATRSFRPTGETKHGLGLLRSAGLEPAGYGKTGRNMPEDGESMPSGSTWVCIVHQSPASVPINDDRGESGIMVVNGRTACSKQRRKETAWPKANS